MIDVQSKGRFWWARGVEGRKLFVWFREIDEPFRKGRGVRIIGDLAAGFCVHMRDQREDYGALRARDLDEPPERIRRWH